MGVITIIGVNLKLDKVGGGSEEEMRLRENENRVGAMHWSFQWSQELLHSEH